MKRMIVLLMVPLLMAVATVAEAQTCTSWIYISDDYQTPAINCSKIRNAFLNYKSYAHDGHYEICFSESNSAYVPVSDAQAFELKTPLPSGCTGKFELLIPPSDTSDVYVVGLNLKKKDDVTLTDPLLTITNNSPTAKVILKQTVLTNIKDGLAFEGAGKIEVLSSQVTGDAAKLGSCITAASPGAKLDGVIATKCGEGIAIHADDVKIVNKSVIFDNRIGVHVYDSYKGTDIQTSKIYLNDDLDNSNYKRSDGVRIDAGVAHAPSFYELEQNQGQSTWKSVADNEAVYDFQGRKPYILLPIPDNETRPAYVEFFFSDVDKCGVYTNLQPCDFVLEVDTPLIQQALRVQVDPAALRTLNDQKKPMEITIPEAARDKAIVMIYYDPELGTAGISRQFKVGSAMNGPVALISTPYDIPTSNATDSDPDTGGNNVTTDGVAVEGSDVGTVGIISGGDVAAAGPKGCGGSITGDQFRTVAWGLDLWWVLVTIGFMTSLRLVAVRARSRNRR